jgi:two-component system, cell cycle sensor histidine kinase and response regulator CckA
MDPQTPALLLAAHRFTVARRKLVPPSRPARALVVDDEESVRRLVNRILTDAGYETVVAAGGPEAEAATRNDGPFDVLVTDLMMPGMSGDELARRLRQREPRLKVLYLTGFSDHLFKEKSTLWADEAFLEKPCSVNGLLEAVSLLLSGRLPPQSGHVS